MKRLLILVAVALLSTIAKPGNAQDARTAGFSLNRFDASERGSNWFSVESLDLRGDNHLILGFVGDWAHQPLVIYDGNDEEVVSVVEDQLAFHLGGTFTLSNRVRLALNLPIYAVNSGEPGTVGADTYTLDEGAALGDLRLGVDVRLLGEYRDMLTVAAGVQLHLPTGQRNSFTGDESVRVVPRVLAAGDIGLFTYGAKIGINIRGQSDNFAGKPFGTEATFSAAAGARLLDGALVVGPELFGSTVLADSGAFEESSTPFELVFGGHYRVGDFQLSLGVGPGLSRGLGSPESRVLFGIDWYPEPEQEGVPTGLDDDGDGILNADDACPDVPGVASEDPASHGCPAEDRDGDGILDADDACPDVAGVASEDASLHGCPPADGDGDGIIDSQDACPDVPGVASADPATNGCPADTDGDTILDADDACPKVPGKASSNPQKNGCPTAQIVDGQIKIIDRVEFDTSKATMRPESDPVLQAVLEIMNDHPDIKKIGVYGHTDNRGAEWYNRDLSKRRAAAVVQWLISKGIAANRLTSAGFGPEKPIDTNDTDQGRQNNRRVEFEILERDAAAPGASTEIRQ